MPVTNCRRCGLPLEEGRTHNTRLHVHCAYQISIEKSKSYIHREDEPSTPERMWRYIHAYLKENKPQ